MITLTEQIETYKREAEQAKNNLDFEFAFILLDKAAVLETGVIEQRKT